MVSFKDKFHPRLFTDGNFLLSRVENALLVTRHIRWRVSVGEETFHWGIEDEKKKKGRRRWWKQEFSSKRVGRKSESGGKIFPRRERGG